MITNNLFNILFFKNIKKYGHIISLGYNCEFSYQFFKYHGFVESSLFAWVNTINIDNLIYAINNLDKLLTGEIVNTRPMWRCLNTDIRFHGKAPGEIWMNNNIVDEKIIEEDKRELISRVTHLKEKFINTAKDGKKNLYIYKYLVVDKNKKIQNNIELLYSSLKKIVKNDFDLLFIFEKCKIDNDLQNMINKDNVFLRFVEYFSPEEDVTGKIYDKYGWRKIFNEFKPNFKLKKTKKFKFEE